MLNNSCKDAQHWHYIRRKASRHSAGTLDLYILQTTYLHDLPAIILHHALKPLPNTDLFRQAVCSANALEESEVALWEGDPPYSVKVTEGEEAMDVRYTLLMIDVLNGRRYRTRQARFVQFAQELDHGDLNAFILEHIEDLEMYVDRWNTLKDLTIPEGAADRAAMMGRSAIEWCAKDVYRTLETIHLLKESQDAYRNAYKQGRLYLQLINTADTSSPIHT